MYESLKSNPSRTSEAILVAPDIAINKDHLHAVQLIERTAKFLEPHVILYFNNRFVDIPPEYTHAEITAAINGGCYYRPQHTDEVGEIDVCVLHGHNSQHSLWGEYGKQPYRLCLKKSPYYKTPPSKGAGYLQIPIRQPYSIEQGWEHQEAERKRKEAEAKDAAPDFDVEPPKLTPVQEVMSSSEPIVYYEMPNQSWWSKLIHGPKEPERKIL